MRDNSAQDDEILDASSLEIGSRSIDLPLPVVEPQKLPKWLTLDAHDRIETLLRECQVCQPTERVIGITRAGDGNMNLTLRVRTTRQTVIVKQSRPWVEKFPDIEAPVGRVIQEMRFYEAVKADPTLAARMPRLLGSVPEQFVLVLECLGEANDASALYHRADATQTLVRLLPDLLDWLGRLHQLKLTAPLAPSFANRALRALNHQHIFVIPFQAKPVIDLEAVTPGLGELAGPLSCNPALLGRLKQLGESYLVDHAHLVHGDFFPGSWLICDGEIRVIDPEFSHGGMPEFDLGVLVAHAHLLDTRFENDSLRDTIRELYPRTAHTVDWRLVEDFAAVEVLRRLLGVAQLPLDLDLRQKACHIDAALRQLVR